MVAPFAKKIDTIILFRFSIDIIFQDFHDLSFFSRISRPGFCNIRNPLTFQDFHDPYERPCHSITVIVLPAANGKQTFLNMVIRRKTSLSK